MCDPITAIAAIGTGVSVFGQVKAGQAAERNSEQQAADYSRLATDRMEKAAFDVADLARNYAKFRSGNLAQIGQSGLTRSTFYDVLADDAAHFTLGKQAILFSAKQEATQLRKQGAVVAASGRDAMQGAYINAASTAISGGMSVYNNMTRANGGVALSTPFATTAHSTPSTL